MARKKNKDGYVLKSEVQLIIQNYMKEVAQMLGVELGEEFEVQAADKSTFKAKITAKDIYVLDGAPSLAKYNSATLLRNLLRGRYVILDKPWKPSRHEAYFYVGSDGCVWKSTWLGFTLDTLLYKIGNCYRTYEQANCNRGKWIDFYESHEVLDI